MYVCIQKYIILHPIMSSSSSRDNHFYNQYIYSQQHHALLDELNKRPDDTTALTSKASALWAKYKEMIDYELKLIKDTDDEKADKTIGPDLLRVIQDVATHSKLPSSFRTIVDKTIASNKQAFVGLKSLTLKPVTQGLGGLPSYQQIQFLKGFKRRTSPTTKTKDEKVTPAAGYGRSKSKSKSKTKSHHQHGDDDIPLEELISQMKLTVKNMEDGDESIMDELSEALDACLDLRSMEDSDKESGKYLEVIDRTGNILNTVLTHEAELQGVNEILDLPEDTLQPFQELMSRLIMT